MNRSTSVNIEGSPLQYPSRETKFYLHLINVAISFIGIFPSVFHFLVLLRKSMRQLTVNQFLIGIVVCGIIHNVCSIIYYIPILCDHYYSLKVPLECVPSQSSYVKIAYGFYSSLINSVAIVMITYFTAAMAIIRTLVIKFPLARRSKRLIYSKNGSKIMLTIILVISPFWIINFASLNVIETGVWVPPKNCNGFSKNNIEKMYGIEQTGIFGQLFYLIFFLTETVLFEFIPSILLLITTICLIIELRKNQKKKTSIKQYRSTRLVAWMTISFRGKCTVQLDIHRFDGAFNSHLGISK
ncbi:G-protein coupled receptors family 1 profile domain-containing protein [Caenorhabditis elegans]|uniref:G-protein coupled receptors family 1 profile domain-containing protein n=1 Tax=Caenorhabditis elegans TaxID=6239 RepID=Q9XU31_CAEEL|nr:G-protein coupled receptors family 1 profile domain-containing protein [Caenorhabditis elegans]CAB07191.2 G-protein coupled receptors family 1 profile domain-containing protein [Caenorhabditis elegans]|eukprot:NP_507224.2 Serpentine Receptor, class W [Caenorhabditis elegans]